MPAEVTVYQCGPDNKAIPVDTHDYSPSGYLGWDSKALIAPNGPGFDPDVLKRLDDITSRIEKLEEEIRLLHNSRRYTHQANPNTVGSDR